MKTLFYIATITTLLCSCKQEITEEKGIDDGLITITEAQFQSSKMEIGSPMEKDFEVTVKSSGKIDVPPQHRAKVTTFLGGYVKSTQLLVGNKVAKGQALIV